MGVFNRLKRQIPSHILKTLYFSLIYPLLNYCINTWGYECHRIDKLHKKIIRIISCSKYNAHTEPIFKSLSILKLEDVLSLNVLKFYFKYYHSDLPEYFRCITIIERTQIHNYNTRHRFEIEEYATRTTIAQKCIRNYLPRLLNKTPHIILTKIYTHSYRGFANYFKRYTLDNYSATCTIPNCYICRN